MNWFALLFALLPIGLILFLLLRLRAAADTAGVFGWLAGMLIAATVFQTPLSVLFRASWAGVLASLPITLMVAASIFQVTLMLETGAMARVVAVIKRVAPSSPVGQILIINIGFGTLLAALGATPVSILPPIMLALGYSSYVAIALPALGYDALCTYALLGIPVVVFSNFVGLPVDQVGGYFARFMPVISTCIAFGMLWIVGGWKMMRQGALPTLIAGLTAGLIAIGMNALGMVTITGIAAGLGVILVTLLYLWVTRQPLWGRAAQEAAPFRMSLGAALSPWLLLTLFALLVNAPFLPFFNLTFTQWAMPVEVIPGAPEKIRLFWQAYFWLFVSTLLAFPWLKPTRAHVQVSMQKFFKRAPRPMLASAVFFALAYVMNHSGKGVDWLFVNQSNNVVYIIAQAAAAGFGGAYPLAAPFLGLLGGFISGSEASAIAMLTGIHLSVAEKIGAVGLLIAAASGIGGGLASVISPAKLQNAAASIDRIGEEAQVLRTTFVIALVITAVCALLTLVL